MYLKITNKGNVVPEAFSLVGASTKRGNNSKIGMFGSGNKYSISYLTRKQYDFRIFTGKKEIVFTTVQRKLGEETFNVICINDKETSITSEIGHHWTLWQAIRELYSNAMDEGMVRVVVQVGPNGGDILRSHIRVIKKIHDKWKPCFNLSDPEFLDGKEFTIGSSCIQEFELL